MGARGAVGWAVLALLVGHAAQAPAQTISNVFAVINVNSSNNGGYNTAQQIFFGADVTGGPVQEGYACNNAVASCTSTNALDLFARPYPWNPDQYYGTGAYNATTFSSFTGTMYVSNTAGFPAANPATAVTPTVTNVGIMSFATNVTFDQSTGVSTPTVSWTLPTTGPAISEIWVSVFDLGHMITPTLVGPVTPANPPGPQAALIYNSPALSATAVKFQLPSSGTGNAPNAVPFAGLLAGGDYLISVNVAETNGAAPTLGCLNCNVLSRSQEFQDYLAVPVPEPSEAALILLGLGVAIGIGAKRSSRTRARA